MNVDRDVGGDGAIDEINMVSMEVDDDAFVLSLRKWAVVDDFIFSPSDKKAMRKHEVKGKHKTTSIKRIVLSRSQLDGPSLRSPFVPLANQKGVPNYPGRKEAGDNERELLDSFRKDKNMTMETFVWMSNDALLTRKDALELLKGDTISYNVIVSYVVLVNRLMEENPKYAKDMP